MDDIDEWFVAWDLAKHRKMLKLGDVAIQTHPESICKTNWGQIVRIATLPYFDSVRFVTVDLMHCLFLGIAKWIVKCIWVDEEILTTNTLKIVQKRWMSFRFHLI